MKTQSENAQIMQLESKIDLLRERVEYAEEGAMPDEAGLRQELAKAESALAELMSPMVTERAA